MPSSFRALAGASPSPFRPSKPCASTASGVVAPAWASLATASSSMPSSQAGVSSVASSVSGLAPASAAGASPLPMASAAARSRWMSSLLSTSGSAPVVSSASRMVWMASAHSSSRDTTSGVARNFVERILPSRSSPAWATSCKRASPMKPQLPFTVCTVRKMASKSAESSGLASSAISCCSISAMFSWLSTRNSFSSSSSMPRSLAFHWFAAAVKTACRRPSPPARPARTA